MKTRNTVASAFFLLAASLPAAAQPSPKPSDRELQTAFDEHLKDAPSARFRDVRFAKEGTTGGVWVMCGSVNAKNSMGGYSGFERFIGAAIQTGKNTQYLVMEIGGVANETCQQRGL